MACLLLCIATGFFGTASAYLNINMTLFWVIFALGLAYFSALLGGFYAAINPWQALYQLLSQRPFWRTESRSHYAYPKHLGYWPALGFFTAFIWTELFAHNTPFSLAVMLLCYTAINLIGAALFGPKPWFRHAEFFGVLFRLFGHMAPLQLHRANANSSTPASTPYTLSLQAPFSGLRQGRATSISELLFILFLLSSTSFDGLHQTQAWAQLYWQDIAGWIRAYSGQNIVQAYPVLRLLHEIFQSSALLLSPLVYLGAYLASLALMRRITRSNLSLHQLALQFAYSLLPIALVYHITHYYTLLITQGLMVLRLMSDPFGWGWNLFGTTHWLPQPLMPNMDWVWHSQVGLILLGHIISVYLAHCVALQLFPNRRTALLSQLPMLLLMLGLTSFGLWILAQPITATMIQ